MQRIFGRVEHSIVVSTLISALLLSHGATGLDARVAQENSKKASGPSRKTSPPGESTQIRILPDTDFKRIEFLERFCFDEVNRERASNGLSDLRFFDDLVPVARRYSRRMAEEGFFSHVDSDGLTVRYRLAEAGIKSSIRAENLSQIRGYLNPVPEVVRGWMKSPGHNKNILDDQFTHSAVGVWIGPDDVIYFTQIFIRQGPGS